MAAVEAEASLLRILLGHGREVRPLCRVLTPRVMLDMGRLGRVRAVVRQADDHGAPPSRVASGSGLKTALQFVQQMNNALAFCAAHTVR